MNLKDDTTGRNATASADLQDIAALDRLAGQLASQATLRRYAHQHRTDDSGASHHHGWRRLWAAARHL
jgi:hypothetical protein